EQEDSKVLPPLKVGQDLVLNELIGKQIFSRTPPRYTEASLVKKLEELGIGRPSTYAPTISTVQKRGYVVKEAREGVERKYNVFKLANNTLSKAVDTEITGAEKNKLFPTNTAMIVNDFLVDNFPDITDYSFTSEIEKEFDEIAEGKLDWRRMLDNFYQPFHKTVLKTEKIERSEVGRSRELGVDPKTGKMVYAKLGRFGAYVQLGENPDDNGGEKPKFASLRQGQFLENIALEDAMELFKMPREVAQFEDKPVVVNLGRFGPYVLHDKKFVSIPKDDDPYTITGNRAIELIEAKRIADANRLIKSFPEDEEMQVLNGRFGPYIKAGKKNVKIPKGTEPQSLTYAECKALADATPEKRGRFGRKAAPAAEEKKAPAKTAKKAAKKAPAAKVAKKTTAKTAPKKAATKTAAKKSAVVKKVIPAKKKAAAKKNKR
ncbi:MAG: DNA topoisomerase I, partial [Cytophagia bacterium]|nr:DNA topoisomerase I [Cytophagia bacterium]